MKQNVKYKTIIAIVFLVLVTAFVAWFFASRNGEGGVKSAYDFSSRTTTTQTTVKTTKKKTTKKDDRKSPTTTEKETTTKKATTKTSGKKIVVPKAYANILKKYADAISKKSRADALKAEKLSPLLASCYGVNPEQNIGFYVEDYNGDGTTDLLIGTTDKSNSYDFVILDYYTLKDGKAVNVFQSQQKDVYMSVTKNRILEKATDGSTYTAWYLYGFNKNGTKLKVTEGVIQDKTANAKKPWFTTTDHDGDTSNDKHVSNEAGQKRARQLENAETQLEFIAFSKYRTASSTTTATTAKK